MQASIVIFILQIDRDSSFKEVPCCVHVSVGYGHIQGSVPSIVLGAEHRHSQPFPILVHVRVIVFLAGVEHVLDQDVKVLLELMGLLEGLHPLIHELRVELISLEAWSRRHWVESAQWIRSLLNGSKFVLFFVSIALLIDRLVLLSFELLIFKLELLDFFFLLPFSFNLLSRIHGLGLMTLFLSLLLFILDRHATLSVVTFLEALFFQSPCLFLLIEFLPVNVLLLLWDLLLCFPSSKACLNQYSCSHYGLLWYLFSCLYIRHGASSILFNEVFLRQLPIIFGLGGEHILTTSKDIIGESFCQEIIFRSRKLQSLWLSKVTQPLLVESVDWVVLVVFQGDWAILKSIQDGSVPLWEFLVLTFPLQGIPLVLILLLILGNSIF